MPPLDLDVVTAYIEANIGIFHEKRLASLNKLQLTRVLKRKNPYLFRAKHIQTARELVTRLVDAHLSSNEETLFGDWLEGLAIFVNMQVYGGRKSGITGIDLEFDNNNTRYIVAIKSGPNWGNSSQITKMRQDFRTAAKTLRTSGAAINITAVNGCCYGVDKNPDKGDYFKYCGQRFWTFISGESSLYADIIEPLGNAAKNQHYDFESAYQQQIEAFTDTFAADFCDASGEIDWLKLLALNAVEQ